ncbi:MAG: GTPase [Actinomycetota bacterium]|nr:GTPase [Actinomycetota bacterium]
MTDALLNRLNRLCDTAADLTTDHALLDAVMTLRARLDEPLRVAIAGRVKAGKSTLLNALVGERLAPTDAGECTRIVTWYRNSIGYDATAVLRDGTERSLRFHRGESALEISLDGVALPDVDRLDVGWPSSRLENLILIDTPGLEGLDEQSSARTLRFLGLDDDGVGDVDAVIYLMRHMHRRDADFLEAFTDRSLSHPSPVNAVAVLSRADEIGAARLDALASAATIAQRYAADERVRALCATVLPVAGLIAETATTLREEEVATLRTLVAMPVAELDAMLLSVDRFVDRERSPLTPQVRGTLLSRFGIFGIRFAVTAMRDDELMTASELSRTLLAASGIKQLGRLLTEHFSARARVLKARSVLAGLKDVARRLARDDRRAGDGLLAAVEEVEATSRELSELRLWHLAISGSVQFDEDEIDEIRCLTGEGSVAERLGMGDGAGAVARETALRRIEYWRARAAHPLTGRDLEEACEIVARSYEALYTQAGRSSGR